MNAAEALQLAIECLGEQPSRKEYLAAINILKRLKRQEIATKWSQESIIEALDSWIEKNKRMPFVSDLLNDDSLPLPTTVQKYFGVFASKFLKEHYYPDAICLGGKNEFGAKTKEEWLSCFREQFLKHRDDKGFSSNHYNQLKDEGTASWQAIARHCGLSNWSSLMELAGVEYSTKHKNLTPGKLKVSSVKSPWLERLETAVEKQEELNKQLLDTLAENQKHKSQ